MTTKYLNSISIERLTIGTYPSVSKDKGVVNIYISIHSLNQNAYQDAHSESQCVVLAWGDIPKKVNAKLHNNEVTKVKEMENHAFVLKYQEYKGIFRNKKRPRHPSRNAPTLWLKK